MATSAHREAAVIKDIGQIRLEITSSTCARGLYEMLPLAYQLRRISYHLCRFVRVVVCRSNNCDVHKITAAKHCTSYAHCATVSATSVGPTAAAASSRSTVARIYGPLYIGPNRKHQLELCAHVLCND